MSGLVLAWFSHGAASAVATKLALVDYGSENVTVLNTSHLAEHPDNTRFMADIEQWLGVRVGDVHSSTYRWAVQDAYGPQVYGYTADPKDARRAVRFRRQNPEVELLTPLIERGLTKSDCLSMLDRAGIKIPAMYRLGYLNNNCIGCVKGGMGYWNKIRRDFPDVFDRMAGLERELDHALNSDDDGPVFLDLLDPSRGRYEDEPDMECSLLCAAAEDEFTTAATLGGAS